MNIAIYLDKKARDISISESIVFGSEIILSAIMIKELPILIDAFERSKTHSISSSEYKKAISPFIFESYVDAFKICTYFENYSKAILLMKGYLIHVLMKNSPYYDLYKKQHKEPLPLEDLLTYGISAQSLSPEHNLKEGLANNTISPKMMFQPDYKKVIGLPENIFKTVKYLTEKRNELHFLNDWQVVFSTSFIQSLGEITSFVKKQIKIL